MNIYKNQRVKSLKIKGNDHFEGQSLEKELQQATKEGIKRQQTITNIFYTQRKDGPLPECDIRTDRFELAQDAMDHVNKTFLEKIQENMNKNNKKVE